MDLYKVLFLSSFRNAVPVLFNRLSLLFSALYPGKERALADPCFCGGRAGLFHPFGGLYAGASPACGIDAAAQTGAEATDRKDPAGCGGYTLSGRGLFIFEGLTYQPIPGMAPGQTRMRFPTAVL